MATSSRKLPWSFRSPAQCQSVHALVQHVGCNVFDQQRLARIGEAPRRRLRHLPAKLGKFDLARASFFRRVWHWPSSVVIGAKYL